MFDAVIFDLDGLLIDSEPLWVRAEIEVFSAAGVTLTEVDCARTKGLRVDDVVRFWDAERGLANATGAEVEARLVERVIELVGAEGQRLPGIETALATARSVASHVALASSSPMPIIEAALGRLGLAFDLVLSAKDEPFGKPHPAVFLRTAERLGVKPTSCLVLEDSLNGVLAAKAARMTCIAVPPEKDPRFAIADVIVDSLANVTPELARALARGT